MIDNIDYAILKCLHDADASYWKKRVHQEISDREEFLPAVDSVSLQTVGRHIDALNKEGYLENTIVSPQDVPRDLIIGYRTTEKGENMLETQRETLLKEIIQEEVFGDNDRLNIGQKALAELINNEFQIDGRTEETAEHYSRDELLVMLGMYFLQKKTDTVFGEEQVAQFRDAVKQQQAPSTIMQ